MKKYEPEIIWSDGYGKAHSDYWNVTEFLAWYANNSTVGDTAIWNDRWGRDALVSSNHFCTLSIFEKNLFVYNVSLLFDSSNKCNHGTVLTCRDKFRPDSVKSFKWENCYTIDKGSWGFNRLAQYEAYETVQDLIHLLIETGKFFSSSTSIARHSCVTVISDQFLYLKVAFNGNLLLNVGPRSGKHGPGEVRNVFDLAVVALPIVQSSALYAHTDGILPPIFVDRLDGIGNWLEINGEAIYKSSPWIICQNETEASVFYTKKNKTLYALITDWPENDKLILACPETTNTTKAEMLGVSRLSNNALQWRSAKRNGAKRGMDIEQNQRRTSQSTASGLELDLPALNPKTSPSQHAWVVALTGIGNV